MLREIISAALAVSILFAGCRATGGPTQSGSGLPQSGAGSSNKPDAQIELKVWHAMSGGSGKAFDTILSDFNKTVGKQSGIKATGVFQGTEIMSKIKNASVANDDNNMPDVAQIVGMDIPTAVKIPTVVKAESYLGKNGSKISKDDFYPSFLRAFTYQNELIGVPMNTSTILLFYNEDLFKAAGIANAPKTIAEMAADVQKLTVKKNGKVTRYGLNCQVGRYQLVNFIVEQSPNSFVGNNEGGRTGQMTEVTMGTDGTLNKFLTEWEKVIKTGGYKSVEDNPTEEFATQSNAMAIMSSSKIASVKKLVKDSFHYNVAFLPKVTEQDTSGASTGGSSLVVFNHSDPKRLEAAWKFVEYATSADAQSKWSQATGYLPVNAAAEKLDSMKTFYEKNPQFKVALDQMKASSPMAQEPFDVVNDKANTIITNAMQAFCKGQKNAGETESAIIGQYNSAIKDYWDANS